MLTPIQLDRIRKLPPHKRIKYQPFLKELDEAADRESAKSSFMGYIYTMWPNFISGRHHKIMGDAFDRVISGECKRLIINMGPRHTKSEFASKFLPSLFIGHYPHKKIIQTSHTAENAVSWGRKTRNVVNSEKFKDIFPETNLMADSKAAGRWETSQGGEYFAIGVGGGVAGKGADLFIIDDPHTEQDYIQALGGDPAAFEKVHEWYQTGPRQRLQPGAAIVIVMTRWHMRDLTGKLVKKMTQNPKADQWEIIEFPAIMPDSDEALWPEFWSSEELRSTREELSVAQWNAQYLQNPTAEEGALVKREWWKKWPHEEPPECEFIIQAWDTAFLKSQSADYSACTTWGVWYKDDDDTGKRVPQLILLDAYRERLEFPQLKRKAMEMYEERLPDAFLVEAKASGWPLIFELREQGIPVTEFTPSRGNDKVVRVNAVSDLFSSGVVWTPETRWADEVIEEFASFPVGDHDDYVDSSTLALLRFRRGGFIPLDTDEEEVEIERTVYSPY